MFTTTPNTQTGSGGPMIQLTDGYQELLPQEVNQPDQKLITHIYLLLRPRMSGALFPFFMVQGKLHLEFQQYKTCNIITS
jgi:hypothetical protein